MMRNTKERRKEEIIKSVSRVEFQKHSETRELDFTPTRRQRENSERLLVKWDPDSLGSS